MAVNSLPLILAGEAAPRYQLRQWTGRVGQFEKVGGPGEEADGRWVDKKKAGFFLSYDFMAEIYLMSVKKG